MNTPKTTSVERYRTALKGPRSGGPPAVHPGDPEAQLTPPVKALLEGLLGVEVRLEVRTEGGRPDLGVWADGLLAGFVELKAPGKGLDPKSFRGHDREQWERFKDLPNLVYTNGEAFVLYRQGAAVREATLEQEEALVALLEDFRHWQPQVPRSAEELARFLAPIVRFLRRAVNEAVKGQPDGPLARLWGEWQRTLLPEADAETFADAYAQLLAYGFLLARGSGAQSLEEVLQALAGRYGLIAEALYVANHPRVLGEIRPAYDLLRRAVRAVDPEALRGDGKADPWLYFYEEFLRAYDPELRKDRGVYYTPVAVVQAMVRLVDDLLRGSLGRALGLAEEGVTVLDPAAGTGTFLLSVLERALENATARYGEGARAQYATEVAQRLHAFEIMIGPYAVAQLRLSQAVAEAGGQIPPEGLKLYLADTLEAPDATPLERPFFYDRLAEERRRAAVVKRETPILVCIGNPPYDRGQKGEEEGQAKGRWIVFGKKDPHDPTSPPPLEDFLKPAREQGLGRHLKNLYNLYVYFWRWASWKVFEQNPGAGIIAFITASSYLRGPAFAGMREWLRRQADAIHILDLGGDGRGGVQEENVFNIQTPVAIALAVRHGEPEPNRPARVLYHRVEGTTREAKLKALEGIRALGEIPFQEAPTGWGDPFLPVARGVWSTWPLLTDLFPWQHNGVKFGRTWPIGPTREVLEARWRALLESKDRASAFKENDNRVIGKSYPAIQGPGRLPPVRDLPPNAPHEPIRRYGYRSFDRAWAIADGRLCDRPGRPLWASFSEKQVYLASLLTKSLGEGPALSVSAYPPDLDYFCNRGAKDILPLYRDAKGQEPNLTKGLLETLAQAYGFTPTPEDLAAYVYALLAHPGYTERFREELRLGGPRVPLTRDPGLFREAVGVGQHLLWLHTYGERFGDRRAFQGLKGRAYWRKSPTSYPVEHCYNQKGHILHVGDGEVAEVAPEVWDFRINRFHPLRNWLDRRKQRSGGRRSSPLDGIQPQGWTADLSRELLELIWVLEGSVDGYPRQEALLGRILDTPTFAAGALPEPRPHEREAPGGEDPAEGNRPRGRAEQGELLSEDGPPGAG